MKKSFLLVPAMIMLASSMAFSDSKPVDRSQWTDKDYWKETRLTLKMALDGDISSETCLANFANFSGCLDALNAGITVSKDNGKNYYVRPSTMPSSIDGFEVYTMEFNDPKDKKIKEDAYDYSAKIWFQRQFLLRSRTDFDIAFIDFKKNYITSDNESFVAGIVYNAFLEKSVDPHTRIIPTALQAKEVSQSGVAVGGPKGGFGFSFKLYDYKKEPKILIGAIMKNSAAEAAGIEEGDIILSINGETKPEKFMKELADSQTAKFDVIGSKGHRKLTITRSPIIMPNVDGKIVKSQDGRSIGYISLKDFMDNNGCQKVTDLGEQFIKSGAEGIVLDLRNNPGGQVTVAQCINEKFLEEGSLTFVNQVLEGNTFHRFWNSKRTGPFRNIPTTVLINGGSASASEIVSSYLQAYRKAYIVGENSFGKGTMQMSIPTRMETILRRQTIAKYYGPNGVSPQLQGIIPDIEVLPGFDQKEPTPYGRERDLYSNAIINAPKMPQMMEDRVQEIATIKDCLAKDKAAENAFNKKDEFKKRTHDNQLTVAVATLDCAIKNNIPLYKGIDIPTVLP
jgi:carboxyl-terminal processing protease